MGHDPGGSHYNYTRLPRLRLAMTPFSCHCEADFVSRSNLVGRVVIPGQKRAAYEMTPYELVDPDQKQIEVIVLKGKAIVAWALMGLPNLWNHLF